MHILFVTATRIGDAVLSTGLLNYLIERYPDARLTIAAGPVAAPLFEAVPRLERVVIIEKRRWALHWVPLYAAVAARRWDLVIDLRGSARSWQRAMPASTVCASSRGSLILILRQTLTCGPRRITNALRAT